MPLLIMWLPTEQRYLRSYRHIVRSVTGAGQLQINHHITIASRSNKNTGLSNPLNNYLFMVLLCPSTQSSHISKQQSDLCSNGFFVVFICKIYRFISYGLFNSVYRGQSIQLLPVKFYELYLEYIILVYCLK